MKMMIQRILNYLFVLMIILWFISMFVRTDIWSLAIIWIITSLSVFILSIICLLKYETYKGREIIYLILSTYAISVIIVLLSNYFVITGK